MHNNYSRISSVNDKSNEGTDIDALANKRIAEIDEVKAKKEAENLAWRVEQIKKKRADAADKLRPFLQKIIWIVVELTKRKAEEAERKAQELEEIKLREEKHKAEELAEIKLREEKQKVEYEKSVSDEKHKAEMLVEARLREEKRKAEELSALLKIKNEFIASPEFKYVEQFIKIYGKKASKNEVSKLHLLLKHRKWELPLEHIELLINEVVDRQNYETAKSKILSGNVEEQREIIEAYLNNYRSDDDLMLNVLAKILREKGFLVEDASKLKQAVIRVEEEIQVDSFENFLFIKSEQNLFEDIDRLNGYEFEQFLKELFTKMGYQVEQTKLSGDQGADLVVVKFGEKAVIQAKRFGGKVGNKAVQEIMAAISLYKARKGIVVTNNYFTFAAVELANANNVQLIDRDALEELINKHW